MKKLAILILILGVQPCWSQDTKPDSLPYVPLDSLTKAFDLGFQGLKMHRADLTFRGDYLEPDSYRLDFVDSVMNDPLSAIQIAASALSYSSFGDYSYDKLIAGGKTDSQNSLGDSGISAIDSLFNRKTRTALGAELIPVVENLMALAKTADPEKWPGFSRYSIAQRDSLVEGFTLLLEESVDDEYKTVDQLDSIAQYEDLWAQKLVTLADGCQGRGEIVDKFLLFLNSLTSKPSIPLSARHLTIMTDYGEIIIGDSTNNHYQGDLFIVIDPGGSDTYDLRYNGVGHQTYIIDYSGNDVYNLPKNRVSPFFFGANMLIDFDGDDSYNSGSFGLGAGLFGVGILWDKKGNDKYFGDTFTQGAGCFGVGILRDDNGNDSYDAALYAQGFGFIDGVGILDDFSGNDTYRAGGKYKDILRYKDHYLSLSQGFAYGLRPKMSGGVGMLIDKTGNDTYVSDIFGQGASYWYSLGILSDGAGNDQYLSFQYAQGAGTHMTVGVLYDVAGDDVYSSKGVSQGCGHDRAAGILADLDGNDNYSAYDLSQAAGSANGLGILADLRGSDAYVVRSDQNTQGFGQARRDYGSIGIFIDLGGKDGYAGGVGRDSTWWSDSKWGVGIDQ